MLWLVRQMMADKARGVGELVGEQSLFSGGTRQASLVGVADGFLAVIKFEELERLRASNDQGHMAIARRLNHQLARAALSKELEASGVSLSSLSEVEIQERLLELRMRQASQRWGAAASAGGGADGKPRGMESLLLRKLNSATKSATKKARKQSGALVLQPPMASAHVTVPCLRNPTHMHDL